MPPTGADNGGIGAESPFEGRKTMRHYFMCLIVFENNTDK
jgi:hypothetical protein